MIQPDNIHPGRLRLRPIFAKKAVIISTGQTIHQTRPRKIADNMINGHQSLQTKLVVRFVLLSCLEKVKSIVQAEKPIITNARKDENAIILKVKGKY